MRTMPISKLDSQALKALAEYYEQALDDVRSALKEKADSEARQQSMRERRASIWDAAMIVKHHMAAGMSLDQAKAAACRETGLDYDLIHMSWRRYIGKENREKRAIECARLARRGLTNEEIARRVGLKHPGSVTRLLKG